MVPPGGRGGVAGTALNLPPPAPAVSCPPPPQPHYRVLPASGSSARKLHTGTQKSNDLLLALTIFSSLAAICLERRKEEKKKKKAIWERCSQLGGRRWAEGARYKEIPS